MKIAILKLESDFQVEEDREPLYDTILDTCIELKKIVASLLQQVGVLTTRVENLESELTATKLTLEQFTETPADVSPVRL